MSYWSVLKIHSSHPLRLRVQASGTPRKRGSKKWIRCTQCDRPLHCSGGLDRRADGCHCSLQGSPRTRFPTVLSATFMLVGCWPLQRRLRSPQTRNKDIRCEHVYHECTLKHTKRVFKKIASALLLYTVTKVSFLSPNKTCLFSETPAPGPSGFGSPPGAPVWTAPVHAPGRWIRFRGPRGER